MLNLVQLLSATRVKQNSNVRTPLTTVGVGKHTALVCLDIDKTSSTKFRKTPLASHVSYLNVSASAVGFWPSSCTPLFYALEVFHLFVAAAEI